jgi:hypothetical protein
MTIYSETYSDLWGSHGKTYMVSTFNTDKVKIYSKDDRYGAHEKTLNEFVKMFKRK